MTLKITPEKRKKAFILSIFIILTAAVSIWKGIDGDMAYNFSFAHSIKNGALPYRDLNMIMTPLLQLFSAAFLRIWDHVYMMKILGCIFAFFMELTGIKIVSSFIKDDITAAMVGGGTALFLYLVLDWNYNLIGNGMAYLGLYLIIQALDDPKYDSCWLPVKLGCVCTVALLCKQNQGLMVSLMLFVGYFLAFTGRNGLKTTLKRALFFIPPVFAGLITLWLYLSIKGITHDFIDMCIVGIWSFRGANSFGALKEIAIYIAIILFLYIIFMPKSHRNEKTRLLLTFSMISILSAYPLLNFAHFSLSLSFAYLVFTIGVVIDEKSGKLLKTSACIIPAMFALSSMAYSIDTKSVIKLEATYYNGVLLDKELKSDMDTVNDYILGNPKNKYYLMTEFAAMFHTARDGGFDNFYDIFFDGNLGTKDAVELVKIQKGHYFIVNKDPDDDFFQINKDALNYIRAQELVDTFGEYEVFLIG